jgi:ornithine decarboxylase
MEKATFIISRSCVLEKYNQVKNMCDLVSYSSKTNPLITKMLEETTDSLFSVHHENELKHIKDKSRAIFLLQGTSNDEIERLIGLGVETFVVDNEPDLDRLLEYMEKGQKPEGIFIKLFLRVKLKENTLRTERHFVFGLDCEIVNKRLVELSENKNIKELGIHFHRKTQNLSEWNLIYEFENMIEKNALKCINAINIGGGLPSVYKDTNTDVINIVFRRINEFREFVNKKGIDLMIEPGRFIAAPSGRLVTYIKAIYDNNIIVNASVYNSDMDAILVPTKLLVDGELEKGKGKPYVVKGTTPCSLDLFRYRVYLKNPKVGDKLIFLNAGAYNFSSDFCDLDKLESVVVDSFE